jgi:DNA polymerase III subunit delta
VSDELQPVLAAIAQGQVKPVYLVLGEEFLVRQELDRLEKALVPAGAADLNLVVMDGASPREVSQELSTLPMFGGRKVVVLKDPEFLLPRKGRPDGLNRAREAWKANRRKEGARRVLALAARAGWSVKDLDPTAPGAPAAKAWDRELGVSLAEADVRFLQEVQAYCQAEGLTAPQSDETALLDWLASSPSVDQVLLVAASEVDTKGPLYKAVKDKGLVLERKAGGKTRDLDLSDFVARTLEPHQAKLGAGALDVLIDRVGGNFRLLHQELEKLALHAGAKAISKQDVELLVAHAREEDYFELSDALQKRDFEAAFKYVREALDQGAQPLALLGSIASIVRGLLMGVERLAVLSEGKPPRGFKDFEARIFPRIEAEAKAAKVKVPHPYAAFKQMEAAQAFGRQHLLRCLVSCAEADLALKLGGGELVLERLLWTLGGKARPWESGMHVIRREKER